MKVFVFDLDFTLWNAGDTFCSETNPPYYFENDKLIDQNGRWIQLYPEVPAILELIKSKGTIMAIASRSNEPTWAMQLLRIFDIEKYFDIIEIYPGCKTEHLKMIQIRVDTPYHQIIFFDDEERNINDVESIGVVCARVNNGINLKQVLEYL